MAGKSKDPVQQKLRDHKSKWNSDVSSFITKLIAFKRGINGRGDTKFDLPVSKIQDPFPQSVPQILSTLTSEYEKLAKEAVSIIKEQENYSKTRRKKKQASYENYQLEANAGKISRFWSYVKAPFLDEEHKKHRITLLRTLAEIDDDLISLQETLVSKNFRSLQKISDIFSKLENKIKFVRTTTDYLKIKTGPNLPYYQKYFNYIKNNEIPYMEAISELNSEIVSRWSAGKIKKNIGEFFYYLRENPKATIEEVAPYIQKVEEEYKSELKEANIKSDLMERSFQEIAKKLRVPISGTSSSGAGAVGISSNTTDPKIEFDKEQNEHRYLTYCVQQHSANPILTKISFDDKHQDYIDFNKLFIDLEKEFNFIKKNPLKPKNNFEKALQKIKIKRAEILKNILSASNISSDVSSFEELADYIYNNSGSGVVAPSTAPINPTGSSPINPAGTPAGGSPADDGVTANFVNNKILKRAYFDSEALEKNANVVSRWLKKKIHELSPFDKTSALRLDAFEKSENSREILKEIMEDLEEDLDIIVINKKIKQLEFSFNAIKYVIDVLSQYYSANAYKYEEKEKDSGLNIFKSKR